jgi:PKD repeat protein
LKDGLENIDEIFKKAFDGFEVDVDPSVWSNVQNAVNSGAGASGASSATSVSTGLAKATLLKIVAGVVAIGTLTTSVLYFSNTKDNSEHSIAKNNVVADEVKQVPLTIGEDTEGKPIIEKSIVVDEKVKEKIATSLESTPSLSPNRIEENKPENDKGLTVDKSEENGNKEVANSKSIMNPKAGNIETTGSTKGEGGKGIEASIIVSNNSGKAPLEVEFSVEGENVESYVWDFGDGSSVSTNETPFHTFYTPNTYKISLTVFDAKGTPKTVFKYIKVEKDITSSLGDIPNVITPTIVATILQLLIINFRLDCSLSIVNI